MFFGVLFGRPRWLQGWRLQILGVSSYSIYLLQYLVIFIATRIMYGDTGATTVNWAVIIGTISVFLIVILGALSFRFVEQRWMRPAEKSAIATWVARHIAAKHTVTAATN